MKTQILGILLVLAVVVAFAWVGALEVKASTQGNVIALMLH